MFFSADSDATGGGSFGAENGDVKEKGSQNQDDPFASIDFEMLDDDTAEAVRQAQKAFKERETNLQALQNRFGHLEHFARTKQSELDKLKATLNNQNGDQNKEVSFDETLKQLYIEEGLTEAQAEQAARLQSKVLSKHAELIDKKFSGVLSTVGKTAASSKAELVFQSVRQSNEFLQDSELAQEVWESVETLIENNQPVTPELIGNLADLKAMKKIKEGKMKLPERENNNTTFSQTRVNQQSRFSFPGAGHALPSFSSSFSGSTRPLDPETAAAVQATVAYWPKSKGVK